MERSSCKLWVTEGPLSGVTCLLTVPPTPTPWDPLVTSTYFTEKNLSVKGLPCSADRSDHRILLRTHVSKAAGKGEAVLDALCLGADTINACFINNPRSEEAAVQAGLTAWVEGRGTQPPTWETLLAAMETAGVGQMHILDLKKKLGLS